MSECNHDGHWYSERPGDEPAFCSLCHAEIPMWVLALAKRLTEERNQWKAAHEQCFRILTAIVIDYRPPTAAEQAFARTLTPHAERHESPARGEEG